MVEVFEPGTAALDEPGITPPECWRLSSLGVWPLVVIINDESFEDAVELFQARCRRRDGFTVRSVRDIPGQVSGSSVAG